MTTALGDLKVLDLTTYLPGPYASLLLADLGATVLHVESPAGDPARHRPQRIGDDSALHWWLGRNKLPVTLDLKSDVDRVRFRRELVDADIVLEGFVPGVARRLGVDYETCVEVNPAVIYCSISGYGQDGADATQASHDINLAARAGLLDQARGNDAEPVPIGPPLADLAGSLHVVVAVLAALHHRERTGQGQYIDVSLFGSILALTAPQLMKAVAGAPPEPETDLNLGADPGYRLYRTSDGGHVAVGALEEKFWGELCRLLDRPDLVGERVSRPGWVAGELATIFANHDRTHWRDVLGSAGVCVSVVNRVDEVAADPWVRETGAMPDAGDSSGLGPTVAGPIRMSRTPPSLTRPAVPFAAGRVAE